MTFYELMLNLLIGISGGIFSSIMYREYEKVFERNNLYLPLNYQNAKQLDDDLMIIQKKAIEYRKNSFRYFRKRMINDISLRILFIIFVIILLTYISFKYRQDFDVFRDGVCF